MTNIAPINQRPQSVIQHSLLNEVSQLFDDLIAVRNLPVTLLSQAFSATVRAMPPCVAACFTLPDSLLRALVSQLHDPPRFDDFLDVARADRLLQTAVGEQQLSFLYNLGEQSASRSTTQALARIIRSLLRGSVAEPLAINPIARLRLSVSLYPACKPAIPADRYEQRLLQFLAHRYLLRYPDMQTVINLNLVLLLCKGYLPPWLQQLLLFDPLCLLNWRPPIPTPLPAHALARWNQTLADSWNFRAPERFLAGYTADTLNTPARYLPIADLAENHCFSFWRPLQRYEVPQCLVNRTGTASPSDWQVHTFTGSDIGGLAHLICRVEVGSTALRIGEIHLITTSRLTPLTASQSIDDGVGLLAAEVPGQQAVTRHPQQDTHMAARAWQLIGDIATLKLNFPPGIKGEQTQQTYASHQFPRLAASRSGLVEEMIATAQRQYHLVPAASRCEVQVKFHYADGVPGEKRLPLTLALTLFRGNDYVVIYPHAWYQQHAQAIEGFEAYRGYNHTTAPPLSVRFQHADFQRLKRKNLWPASADVHPADFIGALAAAFNFNAKIPAEVMFIDGQAARNMPLARIITTDPDIIQIIKWPSSFPVAATRLLERYRHLTTFSLRQELMLEIAVNKHSDQQNFPPFSLREMKDQLASLRPSALLANLDTRLQTSLLLDKLLSEAYDDDAWRSGLTIPQTHRLSSSSQVSVVIWYTSGADGSETKVSERMIALEKVAYNQLHAQYGINHRFEVEVPPAIAPLFTPENAWDNPRFPITDSLYLALLGNTRHCQGNDVCYTAIAELQRRLIHYRLASYLVTISERDPMSWRDHIEQNLLQPAAMRYQLQSVEFDGQPLATFFAIRGAGQMLLFDTLSDGVIILHEQQQTFLSAQQAERIFRALPLAYTLKYGHDKSRLNITLATGSARDGSLGKYTFVSFSSDRLPKQLTDQIFAQNIADIEALFHIPTAVWSAYSQHFAGDSFTGVSQVIDLISSKSLATAARMLTAIDGLVKDPRQSGFAYGLAKLAREQETALPPDIIAATGFDFNYVATRRYSFFSMAVNLIRQGRALTHFIAQMNANQQTAKSLRWLARGRYQPELSRTQLRVPFDNAMLKLRYPLYNSVTVITGSLLKQVLKDGRKHARQRLIKAIAALADPQKKSLVDRLLQLFFAKHDDSWLQTFIRQLQQMKRDLNELNVSKHIAFCDHADADEASIMALDQRHYQLFLANYQAIRKGVQGVERYADTVIYVATQNLLNHLNQCTGHVIDCAADVFISQMTRAAANTLEFADASEVGAPKGVRDFTALINLNDRDYDVPEKFRGRDALFLQQNRAAYGNLTTAGIRNTQSHTYVIYLLASMAANGLVEQAIANWEKTRIRLPM